MAAIWTRPFYAWVQHANHSAAEPQYSIPIGTTSSVVLPAVDGWEPSAVPA